MIGIKLALRNIIRMPKRTVINLFLLLLVVASVTSGVLVYTATGNALKSLDESYTFVESMVSSTPIEYSNGDLKATDNRNDIKPDEFRLCIKGADILAYNVFFNDRILFVPPEELLYDFKQESDNTLEAMSSPYMDCYVYPTNNLYLERKFFTGTCRIIEGADFSAEAYKGNSSEIIIPKWFADEYRLSVGDSMCYYFDTLYYKRTHAANCVKGTVTGIYENEEKPLSHTENHIYIPLQFLMRAGVYISLGFMNNDSGPLPGEFRVARADFVLRDRDAFSAFAENAVKNGVDTNKVDIVFNNAEYDMIRDGLLNVRVVVLVVVAIIGEAGAGILVTFTVNIVMSRDREKQMLRAVGMKKSSVVLMFTAELLLVMLLALPLGIFTGRIVSDGICRYADGMVESDVEELRLINRSETSVDELLLPLSCNIKMSISSGTVESSCRSYVPYRPEEGGVDVRVADVYNANAANYTEAKTSVWTPLKLAAANISDISPLVLEDRAQELEDSGTNFNFQLRIYVTRSSGYEIGDIVLANANPLECTYTQIRGYVQPMFCTVCGYFDGDLLGLDGEVFLTTEEDIAKTGKRIYIEILPHCDMVINPTEK